MLLISPLRIALAHVAQRVARKLQTQSVVRTQAYMVMDSAIGEVQSFAVILASYVDKARPTRWAVLHVSPLFFFFLNPGLPGGETVPIQFRVVCACYKYSKNGSSRAGLDWFF